MLNYSIAIIKYPQLYLIKKIIHNKPLSPAGRCCNYTLYEDKHICLYCNWRSNKRHKVSVYSD